jgi:hypothetical protein
MLVVEYWPTFVERSDEPRKQFVDSLSAVREIPWIKAKGDVRIAGAYVKAGNLIVAIIMPDQLGPYHARQAALPL